ncbi:Zinc finger C-x8-C-x5-C-x3-H type (and similar) [Lotmaria passim]
MNSTVSSTDRTWHAAAPRPICNFFAMGGCNKGDRCPFSHELVQVAPKGVDVSNGFYISGKVANYKAASTAASPSSPNSGRKSDEAGNASSTDGLSTLASPSSYSVTGVSLSAEAKEWVGGDGSGGVTVVTWATSATTSTSSTKSQRAAAWSTSRAAAASPPQAPPSRVASPAQPISQPVQYNRPPHQPPTLPPNPTQVQLPQPLSQVSSAVHVLSAPSQDQPQQQPSLQQQQPSLQQQQPLPPLPPQPRSVANARQSLAHATESPAPVNKYAPPQTTPPTAVQAAQPTALVGKYSISHPVIQTTSTRSGASASSFRCPSPSQFSPAAPSVASAASSAPSSSCGGLHRESDVVPAIVPTAPPRYTASSTVIASPTTAASAAASLLSAPPSSCFAAITPELPPGTGMLATRAEAPSGHLVETPLPRSRELNAAAATGATSAAEHAAFGSNKYSGAMTSTAASAAPPQYETKTATTATPALNGQCRVLPPAPRSQQQAQQQQQQLQQLRAQFQTQQQQQPQQQPQPQHEAPFQQQRRQFQQQQQQQHFNVQTKQSHVPQQSEQLPFHRQLPQQNQYQAQPPPQRQTPPQQQQQQQTVYLVAQPRSVATATPSRESPTAAAAPQIPCGYSLAYALPTNAASSTQVLLSEQPGDNPPMYTLLSSGSPQTSSQQPQQQSLVQTKNPVVFLTQAQVAAPNGNAAAVDNAVPRFILVKADGTFTILQTAY